MTNYISGLESWLKTLLPLSCGYNKLQIPKELCTEQKSLQSQSLKQKCKIM
jgi:hypothetical protein